MARIETVTSVVKFGLIGIFMLIIIHLLGTVILGGYMYPIFNSIAPNQTTGISQATYLSLNNQSWLTFKIAFYMLIGIIFSFILLKLLYEKESTSTQYGN